MQINNIFSWLFRLVAAIILLQTLFFKFTGNPESVELFSQLVGSENEAYARIFTGILELIVAGLLLIPPTVFIGAVMGLGIMGGAILSHLLVLGIQSQNDGGLLFIYACVVAVCCLIVSVLSLNQGLALIKKFLKNDIR